MSEFDTGYSVVIGKSVVHAEKKATGSSVSFPCEAIPDGSYLVSLEVNGSVKAYRESMDFSSGSCTVGEYTLSYSSYALTVSGTSNNDIVRVMVEPLEVKTTDAFRAAVKKDAPKSEGSSGGGAEPLILHITDTPISGGTKHELDKTAGEIYTEFMAGKQIFLGFGSGTEDEIYPVWMLKVKNGYVAQIYINKGVLNADFNASNATTKPYYTTSSSGSND